MEISLARYTTRRRRRHRYMYGICLAFVFQAKEWSISHDRPRQATDPISHQASNV